MLRTTHNLQPPAHESALHFSMGFWLIWSIVLWKQSTSPAKKMMRMTIVDANTGLPASVKQMVLREALGKWVLGAVTGFISLVSAIMLFVTPRRQVIWDYIGTTVVVRN